MSLVDSVTTGLALVAPISAFGGIMWRHFAGQIKLLKDELASREEEITALKVELRGVIRTNRLALPLWTQDAAGRVLWASPRALLVIFAPLGLALEDIIGKDFSTLFGAEVAREIDRLDRRALTQIDSTQFAIINFAPGTLNSMFVTKTVTIDDDGQIIKQGAAFRLNELAQGDGQFANELQRMISRANLRDRKEEQGDGKGK